MIVDDRLETVLRTPASGAAGARTQFRQLIDILDRLAPAPAAESDEWYEAADPGAAARLRAQALDRLDTLAAALPEPERVRLVEEAALRSPWLVAHFAAAAPRVAAAAIAGARLSDSEWAALAPDLPLAARGFLRHRRDLGPETGRLLARLGIGDMALPLPSGAIAAGDEALIVNLPSRTASEMSAEATPDPAPNGIAAIVARIEAVRQARAARSDGSGEPEPGALPTDVAAARPLLEVDCALDSDGTVVWADGAAAAMLTGHRPFDDDPAGPARCDFASRLAARQRRPVVAGRLALEGAAAIAGDWRIDAAPLFAAGSGHFTGWRARLRRPAAAPAATMQAPANDDHVAPNATTQADSDRLRQLLHELRTPVNAIQGFAEMIQQQALGVPVAHDYRGQAATIAADAARILADFDELDRLARFESGRQRPDDGTVEVRAAIHALVDRLAPLFDQREVTLALAGDEEPLHAALAPAAFEEMAWRLLSTVASAAQPGERLTLRLAREGDRARLSLRLPAALGEAQAPSIGTAAARAAARSAFALRTIGAEVRAGGGEVRRSAGFLTLLMPLATDSLTTCGACAN